MFIAASSFDSQEPIYGRKNISLLTELKIDLRLVL
jgi:hypothetical protein